MRNCDFADSSSPPASDSCEVCGGRLERRAVVRLRVSCLRACPSCGSWTYSPRDGASGQAALHDSEEYFDHPYFTVRRAMSHAQRRCREVLRRLSAATDIPSLRGQRLLDLGCDTGAFLRAAQQEFGIVPVGMDVSGRAVAVARQQGMEVYRTAVEQAPAALADFPVATAIDLLEHVPHPESFLRAVRARLRPGGLLYLETPNLRSVVFSFGRWLSLLTGGRPAALLERLFPPQHIQMFTAGSLRGLSRRAELDVVRLGTSALAASDIAAGVAVRLGIGALQLCDRIMGTEILLWAVLRRPAEAS